MNYRLHDWRVHPTIINIFDALGGEFEHKTAQVNDLREANQILTKNQGLAPLAKILLIALPEIQSVNLLF